MVERKMYFTLAAELSKDWSKVMTLVTLLVGKLFRGHRQCPKFGGTNAQGNFRVGGLEGGDSLGEIANTKPSPHACQWCVGCPQPWP